MTATAWPGPSHPRGPAGPGPSGPAGPNGPQPSGPVGPSAPPIPSPTDGTGGPWPSAPGPSNPGGPTGPGRLAEPLDTIDQLLRVLQLIHADKLTGADPAGRMQLASGLRTARRAVAALKTPARPAPIGGPVSAAAEKLRRPARAVGGAAVVADRAGGPPAPGAGTFSLPQPQEFQIGIGPLYDALPSVPWPGRPFPVYEVPAP